ncbi:sortase [Enterococcus canintestini]|uniref:Sortase n=1 Tax=Enterococcus canintestini TaxID=317010 RepID=A0A1L8R4R0_9ENTE|nr:sortase [Enterococcus canintestini]OJG14740.1 hypothetical protein RU96_GL000653 [Enterococcus canintestini]
MKRIILAVCLLLVGVGILGYPVVSKYLADKNSSYVMEKYQEEVAKIDQAVLDKEWKKAVDFNNSLAGNPVKDPFLEGSGYAIQTNYYDLLNIDEMMGKLEIPKISVEMPIYHGTKSSTLRKGIGHLEGSSLPVGGGKYPCCLNWPYWGNCWKDVDGFNGDEKRRFVFYNRLKSDTSLSS